MNVSRFGRGLVIAGGLVASVTVAATLWLTGSPGSQREVRLDTVRVRDLRAIEQAAGTHLQQKGALPDTLADVPGADLRRTDPVTGAAYGYRVIAPGRVELCAVFTTENGQPLRQVEPWVRRDWPHAAGPACFERLLDRPSRAED